MTPASFSGRRGVALLAALFAATSSTGAQPRPTLAGHYQATFADAQRPATPITLDCPDETHCTFAIGSTGPTIVASGVRPVTDLHEARNALAYAVAHADTPASEGDDAAFGQAIATLLRASPELVACWDIGDSEPGYLLACRLRAGGVVQSRMFVFATVLAGCGPTFCRFAIVGLDDRHDRTRVNLRRRPGRPRTAPATRP
jgi:hypothetical protein